jgi:hypothetical protein
MKSGENWICVRYDVGHNGGSITSNIGSEDCAVLSEPIEAAINAIESLILAHACNGVNIEDPAYQEGVWTAVDAISNNC